MTGDRVAEIRGRLDVGGLNKRDAADLAYLLAENARLRAQLDAVEELHQPDMNTVTAMFPKPLCKCEEAYPCDTAAALNQGGETNGE